MDIRSITISQTFAFIAGFPFKVEDDIDPLKFQKLKGKKFIVSSPELIPTSKDFLKFPKFEFIVEINGHTNSYIFYNDYIPNELEKWLTDKIEHLKERDYQS